MTTGYVASARVLPLEGEILDVKILVATRMYRMQHIWVEDGGLSLKSVDAPTEAEARESVNNLIFDSKCRIEDLSVEKVFPAPSLSYTYVFSSRFDPKFVRAYVDRVRESGMKATVWIRSCEPDKVFFRARIGLFPDLPSCAKRCNKIFLTSFRYNVHGEDEELPSLEDARPTRLCDADRFSIDKAYEVIEIDGVDSN